MESNSPQSCPPCGAWWKLPVLLAVVLAAMLLWSHSRSIHEAPAENTKGRPAQVVEPVEHERISLEIDFGEGQQKDLKLFAWHEGITVADLFATTPEVTITQQGSGESAFLTSINGIKNQGASGDNWTYSVSGESADRSFAVYQLRPGDRVLWSFAPPR